MFPSRQLRIVVLDAFRERKPIVHHVFGTALFYLGYRYQDDELNAKLRASTGDASPAPMRFFSYKDPEQNAREQIRKVRSRPWIAKDIPVRGCIFDVDTGRLQEVTPV